MSNPSDSDPALLEIGEVCGVCETPDGPGSICGNPLYAIHAKGRLPKHCGTAGQAEWQQRHGTPGNPMHLSDRAGYARKRYDLSPEQIRDLAKDRAAALGIRAHRAPRVAGLSVVSAPADSAPTAPASPDTQATSHTDTRVSADTAPEVQAFAAGAGGATATRLAELLWQAGKLVGDLGAEMDTARAESDERVSAETARAETAETAAAQAARDLADTRTTTAAAVQRAETAAAAAHEARLRAEGEATAARNRATDLERQLTEIEGRHRAQLEAARESEAVRHRAELEALRESEAVRVERILSARAEGEVTAARNRAADLERQLTEIVQARAEHESAPALITERPADFAPPESSVTELRRRVTAGHVTRGAAGLWYLSNATAPRPAGWTLDWMLANGLIVVGAGDPAPVSVPGHRG